MSDLQVNSTNIQQPKVNIQQPSTNSVQQNQQTNTQNPSNITAPIYQYPQGSVYCVPPQGTSGVNIIINNPSGMGGAGMAPCYYPYGYPPVSYANNQTNNITPDNQQPQNNPIASTGIHLDTDSADKTKRTKRIVELTDEYIQTLENYLKHPDLSIRKMGMTELIKRYEEDKSRFSDPALTALLNIALQDKSSEIRQLGLSLIAAGSAAGDENTTKIIEPLQNSQTAHGLEAKMANKALLVMSGDTKEVEDNSPIKIINKI